MMEGAAENIDNPPAYRLRSKTIGNYILGKTLGKGTFGKVKLAYQILTGYKVAIKILEKDRIIDVADVYRVSRYIHILKLIRHPNIIQLYEVSPSFIYIIETPKQLFLVMYYMQKGELFDYIVDRKKIPYEYACRLFQQIISGVEYIHKLNIVHRDLKPYNLLLDYDNTIRIVDFGLSNTYKKDERLKTACGSPCYAAPYMIEGKKKYYALLVDIWSCGVILYAMLCGSLPFEDPETSKLYQKILSGEYKVPKHLSADAKDILSKILNVDPYKRYRIEDIKQHKWWKISPVNTCSTGLIVGFHRIPIDFNILYKLKSLKLDIDLTQKCIEANRHNSDTTTYYLLLKKHIKDGGTSKADLGSKCFDENLIEPNRRKDSKNNSLAGNEFMSGRSYEEKKDVKYNYLNLLKGKLTANSTPHGLSREKSAKKSREEINIDPSSTKNNRTPYDQVKLPSKRGRSPGNDNDNIRRNYREKYGNSLISRSTEKARRGSLKNQTTLFEYRFREYQIPEKRRNSVVKGYKKPSTVSRDRRDVTHYSSTRPYLQPPDIIGLDTPYEKHLMPKWRQNNIGGVAATLDNTLKPEKPYINRRSLYR